MRDWEGWPVASSSSTILALVWLEVVGWWLPVVGPRIIVPLRPEMTFRVCILITKPCECEFLLSKDKDAFYDHIADFVTFCGVSLRKLHPNN